MSRGCEHRQMPDNSSLHSREQIRTNLLQGIHRPSLVVHQGKFDGVKGQVLDFVCRTERHELDIILDLHFAKQAMCGAIGSRTESEAKLPFTIHWDATQLLPILFDELNADTVVPSRCDMLRDAREGTRFCFDPRNILPLAWFSSHRISSRWFHCSESSLGLLLVC